MKRPRKGGAIPIIGAGREIPTIGARVPLAVVQFSDEGIVCEIVDPPEEADPSQLLDAGSVLIWVWNLVQNKGNPHAARAVRRAIFGYREKWGPESVRVLGLEENVDALSARPD